MLRSDWGIFDDLGVEKWVGKLFLTRLERRTRIGFETTISSCEASVWKKSAPQRDDRYFIYIEVGWFVCVRARAL